MVFDSETFSKILDSISEIFLFFTGGAFIKIIDYLKTRKKKKLQENLVWNMENISELHVIMKELTDSTTVEKFLIFKGSNGGGMPKPGNHFYVSVMHEEHKEKNSYDFRTSYKDLLCDAGYISMLLEVINQKKLTVKVDELPNNSILRNIYESEKIQSLDLYFIGIINNSLFFCSVSSLSPNGFETAKDKALIELSVNKIRNIFEKYK